MEAIDILERLGRVEPVDPEVLTRTASALLVAMANEAPHRRSREEADEIALLPPVPTSPRRRRGRVASSVVVAAVAVLLVAIVFVLVNSSNSRAPRPVRPPVGAPSWRLVSSVIPPFHALTSGGQAGLQCVTDDVCYSPGSGRHGDELYRTVDGGRSWHETSPVPMVLQEGGYAFSCADAETCAVIDTPVDQTPGQPARWAITTDGGAHWTRSTVPMPAGIPNASVGQFSCADAEHCVVSVSGGPTPGGAGASSVPQRTGTFLSTSDGGRTWTQATAVPAMPAGFVWTMTCSSGGSCLAVSLVPGDSSSAVVGLSSRDGGKTWVAGPTGPGAGPGIVYSSCGDATHCMLVFVSGPSTAPYEIVTTSDAGLTWQTSGPPTGWLNMPTAVSCATADDCWIAMSYYSGSNPAGAYSKPLIEETHDGGASWSSIPLPSSKPPIADVLTLSCPPAGDGCMGIGNRQDHFLSPLNGKGRPRRLSGPLVISNLPPASS